MTLPLLIDSKARFLERDNLRTCQMRHVIGRWGIDWGNYCAKTQT